MNEEKMKIFNELFSKKDLKRMRMVEDYLDNYGDLILKRAVSPNRVFVFLSKKYEYTEIGVRFILEKAGVYKGKDNPVCFPTDEEKAAKPSYFFPNNI